MQKQGQKERLIEVFRSTLKYIKNSVPKSICVNKIEFPPLDSYLDRGTNISVENKDCLLVAQELVEEGYHTILLNMASSKNPGGGVLHGSRAQEEEICRRTNLYPSLEELRYPLAVTTGLYTPGVIIIKDEKYRILNNPCEIDVVSVAAIRLPKRGMKMDEDLMRYKIRMILSTALLSKQKEPQKKIALVLSAFGCGAYNNDPKDVSRLFKEILVDEGRGKYFDRVVFAIIDDKNSNDNYGIFKEKFG